MPRRKVDVKLLVASFVIAVGIVLVVIGFLTSVTGREAQRLPDAIEEVDPISGATQVPQQTRVFVDLETGYTGVLVIDGVELPTVSLDEINTLPPALGGGGGSGGDQIELPDAAVYEPGNATLTYETRAGGLVPKFGTGEHRATVIFWKTDEDRGRSRTYSWTFYVV